MQTTTHLQQRTLLTLCCNLQESLDGIQACLRSNRKRTEQEINITTSYTLPISGAIAVAFQDPISLPGQAVAQKVLAMPIDLLLQTSKVRSPSNSLPDCLSSRPPKPWHWPYSGHKTPSFWDATHCRGIPLSAGKVAVYRMGHLPDVVSAQHDYPCDLPSLSGLSCSSPCIYER